MPSDDRFIIEMRLSNHRPGQITQHLHSVGAEVERLDDNEGLAVVCMQMSFDCPVMKQEMTFELDEKHLPFGLG